MLSRLALRAGASAWQVQAPARMIAPAVGHYCTMGEYVNPTVSGKKQEITPTQYAENWDTATKTYFGPQRDTKNFPHPVMPETNPPTRLGFIPESWFNAVYDKTGVTGPYMFLTGSLVYMFSKEHWVITHQWTEAVGGIFLFTVLLKKFGPAVGKYLDDSGKADIDAEWTKPLERTRENSNVQIAEGEKNIWRKQGEHMHFDCLREMVDMNDEREYRTRMVNVHTAIKKRLDHQLSKETTERRFQQKHMTKWVVDGVVKGITPQQEKESINKCISELQLLAARQ